MLEYELENDREPAEVKIPSQEVEVEDTDADVKISGSTIKVNELGEGSSCESGTFEFTIDGEVLTIEHPDTTQSEDAKENAKLLGKKTVSKFVDSICDEAAIYAEKQM